MTDRELVESYIPMLKFIAAMSGPRCEVVLHDLANLDHTIIAIENGYLTGRKVGDTLMDFDIQAVFDQEHMKQPYLANYAGKTTVNGRVFRFSTYYIKNSKNDVVGLLDTNVDISGLLTLRDAVTDELFMDLDATLPSGVTTPQNFAISVGAMIESAFSDAMEKLNFQDTEHLNKDEKLQVIEFLDRHNIFSLKGAIGIIGKKLRVSEPTAYRYLRSLKAERDGEEPSAVKLPVLPTGK